MLVIQKSVVTLALCGFMECWVLPSNDKFLFFLTFLLFRAVFV